ncbi:CBO0543 family protein [Halalkalibacter urbisdiaboli]|uniref:CBO0543 family protein n=1 Tax=Halalkalibacter urbisdiaboli TaxID=1960589 RepID=UPI000B43CA86|nr:CBO0543 family protein [Halalkalibacter urbisdiaboli]
MTNPIFDQYYSKENELMNEKFQIWLEHSLFSWQWWFGLILLFISIIFWIRFRKQDSTHRLLYSGFFVVIFSSFFDLLGASIGLFHYHYELFPFSSNYLPWSIAILPISIMTVLQIKPNVNPFLKSAIYSAVIAFIALPLLHLIGVYHPVKWHYFYSFLILFVLYLMAYFLVRRSHFEELT